MRTHRFTDRDVWKGCLMLAAPDFPIRCGYRPGRLIPASADAPDILLDSEAAGMLKKLLKRIGGEEQIVPVSGYRSHEEQIRLWEESMRENGEQFTRTYVAKPGHSEHETGLAIDLAEKREEIDFIRPDFPETGVCGRFRKLAPCYGFTERYPLGKEPITGIGAEPWHFRYVGRPHAEIMKKEGTVLEEYVAFLREETSRKHPYRWRADEGSAEIFYMDMRGSSGAAIELPDEMPCRISGTNEGGIVICLWRRNNA